MMMMMMMKYENYHLLQMLMMTMVLVSVLLPWNANAITIAKPDCADKCGDITIPYPFGFGTSSCYFDEYFEIDCVGSNSSSSSPRAFLKKFNLEVTQIMLPGEIAWIGINNPIISSSPNCTAGGSTASPVVNLTGSTFYFSASANMFGATGCDNQALLLDNKSPNGVGCTSKCSATGGIGECCQSILSLPFKSFNASFASAGEDSGCKYAVLADKDWFTKNPSTSCTTAITESDTVLAWLEWGFYNNSDFATSLAQQTTKNKSFACQGYPYHDGNIIQLCRCNPGFEGNPYLQNGCQDINECNDPATKCAAGTCRNGYGNYTCHVPKSPVTIVVGLVVPLLLIALAIWAVFLLIEKRKKRKFYKQNGGLLLSNVGDGDKKIRIYKLNELKITKSKSRKHKQLGEGGQGTVFKGTLKDDTQVAIKKCKKIEAIKKATIVDAENGKKSEDEDQEMSTFVNEVVVLSQTIHRNIIKLLGCCLESEAPLLVYEFAINGDLSNHLHNDQNNEEFTISWENRLRIATEVAGALSYLHFSAESPIYHRDIKSANILLDNRYRAKLADFGISKSIEIHQSRVNTDLQGSGGYMDPEFLDSRQYTDKCDVYSFGVVLVELLTGRKALFSLASEAGGDIIVLAEHFKSLDDKKLNNFLDGRVKQQGSEKEVDAFAKLARKCLNSNGRLRPNMKEVTMELEKIRKIHNIPQADVIEDNNYDA